MTEPKIYAPASLKEIEFSSGGKLLKVGINVKKFIDFLEANVNAKGWVNLKIERRREPSQYGETHSMLVDSYESKPRDDQDQPRREPPRQNTPPPRDDMPPDLDDEGLPF